MGTIKLSYLGQHVASVSDSDPVDGEISGRKYIQRDISQAKNNEIQKTGNIRGKQADDA